MAYAIADGPAEDDLPLAEQLREAHVPQRLRGQGHRPTRVIMDIRTLTVLAVDTFGPESLAVGPGAAGFHPKRPHGYPPSSGHKQAPQATGRGCRPRRAHSPGARADQRGGGGSPRTWGPLRGDVRCGDPARRWPHRATAVPLSNVPSDPRPQGRRGAVTW